MENWYYALVDENNICISVDDYGEEVPYPDYIRVDSLDDSIIGMMWNGSAWVEPPIMMQAEHSTDEINIAGENKWLTTRLSEINSTLIDKAYRATTYLENNLAALDVNGSLKDSGKNTNDFATANHDHAGTYATANHSHSEYASTSHTHDYAASNHSHSGYASTSHTHSDLASSSHTHTEIANNLNVVGILRVKGQQAISMDTTALSTVLGTGNHDTYIAGKSVVQINATTTKCSHLIPRTHNAHDLGGSVRFRNAYLVNTPNVSSDERLKENIETVSSEKCLNFIDGINPVTYNYKQYPEEKRFGVIAQNVLASDPELANFIVETAPDEYLSVKPSDLVYALIGAVKELKAELDALKAK